MSENLAENHSSSSVQSVREKTPKVSVIVPVYKVEKYLPECIESILAQTFTDFELILVDDGSPDNSGKICDDYAAHDSRIRVFHKENGGVSSARNLGIRHARADYIAFLDSDDWWKPEFLEKMFALSQEYPQASCCCCCWNIFSEIDAKSVGFESLRGVELGGSVFWDVIKYSAEKGRLPIWTGAVVAKKSSLEMVGGFDEDLIVYEDYALWFKLCLLNDGRVAYMNEPLAFYRINTPVGNKPRGALPDLDKHWVTYIDRDLPEEMSNESILKFIDRFRLMSLLSYRGIKKYTSQVREILSKVDSTHWNLRYRLVFCLPVPLGNMLIKIYSWWVKR